MYLQTATDQTMYLLIICRCTAKQRSRPDHKEFCDATLRQICN